MALYETFGRPLLFALDPERAHHLAIGSLATLSRCRAALRVLEKRLALTRERELFGLTFRNPVGLAAGFDKNANALPAWQALGFGFVEVGTITAEPQPGNPKPRIFRVPESQALINRLGFNNDGAKAVAARLTRLRDAGRWPSTPLGINIGKSRVTPIEEATGDYLFSFRTLFEFADYFALNVSSPNTPGLRTLQQVEALDPLLGAVQKTNREQANPRPVLLKIAPDLDFAGIGAILELASRHGLAGIIATNTTLDHSSIPESKRQQGGLSGRPLRARSTDIVRFIAAHSTLPIIAVGGIFDAESACEKFDAGASLVQLYTGYIYRGPGLVREICNVLR